MRSSDNAYFSNESYDFAPFSEGELAMIMGGGDDECPLDNLILDKQIEGTILDIQPAVFPAVDQLFAYMSGLGVIR